MRLISWTLRSGSEHVKLRLLHTESLFASVTAYYV
jgi:hypothetical protein